MKPIIKVNLLIKVYGRFVCLNAVHNKTQQICTVESFSQETMYLYRNIILLICSFRSEDIGYFFMRCCLPANGAFNWAPAGANAVLFYDDSYTLITKTMSTCQHCPLRRELRKTTHHSISFRSMQKKNSVLIHDKLHFHRNTSLFSWNPSD